MLKFYFSLMILWAVISTLNGMNSNILLHENDTIHISYVGQSTRVPVTLSSSSTMLELSGLEMGMSYNIIVNPGDIVTGPAEITYLDEKNENIPGKIIEFEATSELANFKLFTADIGELYYLSISEKVKENPGDPIVNYRNPPAITTNTAVTTNSLVQNILGCSCLTSSVAFGGLTSQRGTFANGTSSIGFGTGIILSTGNISVASGPNNNSVADGGYGNPGTDANLDALTGGNLFDVAKLEFDIIPSEDTISFEYVFASEEYCDYVGSIFNDVFGFFISGPGILGTQNIAAVPGSNNYVSINNVNHINNSIYYRGNIPPTGDASTQLVDIDCIGHPSTTAASTQDCQFDGYTTMLTAKSAVQPGQIYHIKIAIADVGDGTADSAVFLKSNTGSNTLAYALGSVVSSNPGNAIYEGCSNGSFKFTRQGGDINLPLVVPYTISPSSTATLNVDFAPIPTSVTIPAGDTSYFLPVTVLPDGIQEGTESIVLSLITPCQCIQSVIMNIQESPASSITVNGVVAIGDTISCGDVVQLNLISSPNTATNFQWSPNSFISNNSISNPNVFPCTTTNYTVTFTNDLGCAQTNSILIYVNNLPTIGNLSISTPSDTIGLLDTLYLNVQLSNINNLYSLFMKLQGDAAVSSYLTYAGFTAGTLLGTGGSVISTPPVATNGIYDFGITKIGAVPGFSGNGIFYTFKFITKSLVIPNNTQFCFYLDDINAYDDSGTQVGLANQSFYCYTFSDKIYVWPGDLNNSKTVTTADLLPIGYFYNSAGPNRTDASIQWIAQPATLWGYAHANPNGSAYKTFADSNGDGVINNADQAAIGFNMGKIHAFWENLPENPVRTVSDGDILITASPATINPADLPQIFNFEVTLQNTGGLSSLYGVSFNMLFDDEVFDLNTAYIDYSGSIFGNSGSDYINIEYNTDTTISIGLTRYANNSIKGNGKLCNIQLQTRPTFPGSINQTTIKTFVDAANTQAGDPLIIQSNDLIIDLEDKTAVYDLGTNHVIVYPNPANDKFFIYFDELYALSERQQLVVYNYTGQKVFETKIDENPKAINTNLLGGSGFYTLVIKDYRDNMMEINKLIVK